MKDFLSMNKQNWLDRAQAHVEKHHTENSLLLSFDTITVTNEIVFVF